MTSAQLLQAMGDIRPEAVWAAKAEPHRRWRSTARRAVTILIAAALVLAMTTAALAWLDAGDWFIGFFTGRSHSELTPGQQEYIGSAAAAIGQSVTIDGWTVTVDSAIADPLTYYIKLRLDIPEGTAVPEDGYHFGGHDMFRADGDPCRDVTGAQWSLETLDGGDGPDSPVTFLITNHATVKAGSGFSYTDGAAWVLELENICDVQGQVLAEGIWRFEFVFTELALEEIEFISDPLPCRARMMDPSGSGEPVIFWTDIEMTSFLLTPFGASCVFTCAASQYGPIHGWDAAVIMTDGSSVPLVPTGGGGGGSVGDAYKGTASFQFVAPIIPDQVDHIQFLGDYSLPIPS